MSATATAKLPALSLWEKLNLLFKLVVKAPPQILFNLIRCYTLITLRGISWQLYTHCMVLRFALHNLTPRQLQYISPPSQTSYTTWLKQRHARAARIAAHNPADKASAFLVSRLRQEVDVLPDGASSILWIGNRRRATKFVLFFHGGGYVSPALSGHMEWCANAYLLASPAARSGSEAGEEEVAVAVLQYTLCPDALYPTQLKQAVNALERLFALGVKPRQLVIGGDSAGGNLTAQVLGHLLRKHPAAREVTLAEPLAGAFMVSPLVSARNECWASVRRNGWTDMLSAGTTELVTRVVLDSAEGYRAEVQAKKGWAMPMDSDDTEGWFKGLDRVVKEVYVTVGEQEILRDQGVGLAEAMRCGNPGVGVKLELAKNEAHDWIFLEGESKMVEGDATKRMRAWFRGFESMSASTEVAPLTAPVPVTLPDSVEFLSDTQWKVLMALMDTVIPAVRIQDTPKAKNLDTSALNLPSAQYSDVAIKLRNAVSPLDPSAEILTAYLAERPSDNPVFSQVLKLILTNLPKQAARTANPPFHPQGWSSSPLWTLKSAFKSFTTLGKLAHIRSSAAFAPLTGFPAVPSAWVSGGASYPFEFVQFHQPGPDKTAPVEIATDVVIVGSGCGAGVVANRLAGELGPGVRVLVLEKGRHFDASHFPLSQTTGLAKAARQGTKFVEGIKVERVLFEEKKGKKVASGVKGTWTSRNGQKVNVVVRAKKVVVSCGTLWSPVVLMNSGLKHGVNKQQNPNIGKNLYLHPTNFVSGVFDEDIRPWEGGCLTSVVSDFEDLDKKGHGVKLEAMSMMPSFCFPFTPWLSGAEWKLFAAKYRHLNTFIAICRDRDAGHIYRDPVAGTPRINYTPSDFDRAHNLRGILELCRIVYAQGAREIIPGVAGFAPFVRQDGKDAAKEKKDFEKWLGKLKSHGNKPPLSPFASAHQMGTASGVNPMVTTMAIADWIGKGVAEDLRADGVAAKL
ncbi:hypothetical protein N0V88_007740 [Collariella sp. IMI 366227]|nr:hypothetical protein N0V88_007740 [Collariella sp. IMI 366227]